MNKLMLNSITFNRGGLTVLNNINFSLQAGEVGHIKGANGAGKTTLLKLIAGLIAYQHGKLDFINITNLDIRYASHKLGVRPELSVIDNLIYHPCLHEYTKPELLTALKFFQLELLKDIQTKQLSFGQQKKLCLTTLILNQRKLWLLDEPFAGLDACGQQQLYMLIELFTQTDGIVLFTSHQNFDTQKTTWRVLEL